MRTARSVLSQCHLWTALVLGGLLFALLTLFFFALCLSRFGNGGAVPRVNPIVAASVSRSSSLFTVVLPAGPMSMLSKECRECSGIRFVKHPAFSASASRGSLFDFASRGVWQGGTPICDSERKTNRATIRNYRFQLRLQALEHVGQKAVLEHSVCFALFAAVSAFHWSCCFSSCCKPEMNLAGGSAQTFTSRPLFMPSAEWPGSNGNTVFPGRCVFARLVLRDELRCSCGAEIGIRRRVVGLRNHHEIRYLRDALCDVRRACELV